MMELKAVSGEWQKQSDGSFKGTVDASLSARAVWGSEADGATEFFVHMKANSGKCGVIGHYKVAADWKEHYIVTYLDPVANAIIMDAVERDEFGVELARTTLAYRAYPVVLETTYKLKFKTDGVGAAYAYLNDVLVCEVEGLIEPYMTGMKGLEIVGVAGENAEYYGLSSVVPSYGNLEIVRGLCGFSVTEREFDADLLDSMAAAVAVIDNGLGPYVTTLPLTTVPQQINDIANYLAAGLYLQRNIPDEVKHEYYNLGLEMLDNYIETNYKTQGSEIAYGVGQMT